MAQAPPATQGLSAAAEEFVEFWTGRYLGSLRIEPGTAHLAFHQALDPRQFATREELMVAVRAAITSGLPRWMWADEAAL